MSVSLPAVDRRPTPMVAIVGNDAVLAAAPATPVQLAHACLRRGFAVAVPASWGDELVAAEAMRRLASKDKGPAVMCVCPYVRSRLLAPGPDLAPFLVSLVSPPVAAARYLRAVYGERGVHITYIGGCPGGDDSSIDARLTPDSFIADLADHGIALSEQPLVFDSIVPPDRRRWGSLPGGVPSAEVLWSDTDPRTLVEIDRDDVATDLAQHIIAREPVLLDIAPSLGCACSGAIGIMPPRHARSAVAALEPPRALTPVIDPSTTVSLDIPFAEPSVPARTLTSRTIVNGAQSDALEIVLDEMLGIGTAQPEIEAAAGSARDAAFGRGVTTAIIVEAPERSRPSETGPAVLVPEQHEHESLTPGPSAARVDLAAPDVAVAPLTAAPVGPGVVSAAMSERVVTPTDTLVAPATPRESGARTPGEQPTVAEFAQVASSPVRRRTPPAMPSRYPTASIPKTTGVDGRPLPRAYVAKRRTPAAGTPTIDSVSPAVGPNVGGPEAAKIPEIRPSDSPAAITDADSTTRTSHRDQAAPRTQPVGEEATARAADLTTQPAAEPTTAASPVSLSTPSPEPPASATPGASPIDGTGTPDANGGRRPVAAHATNRGVLIFLLLAAVVTLGVFVVITLRP
jgi:hypothetical protein